MAYKSILSYGSKISSVKQLYYSPASMVQNLEGNLYNLYCLLSRNISWADDNNPPVPTQDQKYIKEFLTSAFVAKKITSNDISPVIIRRDWNSGVIYDYYKDDINMFDVDSNGIPVLNYYVKNIYDQVFKCLWNGNGVASTVEPYFEPGSYGTNNIYKGSDGYKWKYIYTIDINQKVKFMDNTWMPVPIGRLVVDSVDSEFGFGSIDTINIIDGGQEYDAANSIININISGDGIGANASPVLSNGSITDIIVTNPGMNYTYANVSITSGFGYGANVVSYVSPIGGHGYDPIGELGCIHAMITCEFNGTESENIPTDIKYHQLGLVLNPVAKSTSPLSANGTIYPTTTNLTVSPGFGIFQNEELIYQGVNLENSTFSATVLSFDPASNVIKTINTKGSVTDNAPIFGDTSKTVRTLLNYNTPDLVTLSGHLTYIENRSSIQRSLDGIEQIKIVLTY